MTAAEEVTPARLVSLLDPARLHPPLLDRALRRRALGVAAGPLAAFAVFTAVIVTGVFDGVDRSVTSWLDGVVSAPLDLASSLVALTASTGGSALWVLVALLIAWRRPRLRLLMLVAVASVVAVTAVELVLKVLIAHPGPQSTRTPSSLIGGPLLVTRGSYPSGHMARAVVVGGALAAMTPLRRRALTAAAVAMWCLAVFWTRVYLQDHWLSDAAGALLLGAVTLPLLAGCVPRPGRGHT